MFSFLNERVAPTLEPLSEYERMDRCLRRRGRLLLISVRMDNDFMTGDQMRPNDDVECVTDANDSALEVKGESRGVNVITGGREGVGGVTRKHRK